MMKICLQCEKETSDTPCPYCGGGVFKYKTWEDDLDDFFKDDNNFDVMQEDIRGGIDRCKLHNFIDNLLKDEIEKRLSEVKIIDMPVDFENEARKLPRGQIYKAGQMNMLMRIKEIK